MANFSAYDVKLLNVVSTESAYWAILSEPNDLDRGALKEPRNDHFSILTKFHKKTIILTPYRSMFRDISIDSKHNFLHIHFQSHSTFIKTSSMKKCMIQTVMEVNSVDGGLR
jgi:hypothetical protein